MPTTVVSFLGTGQKERPTDPRSNYRTTTYEFRLPNGQSYQQRTSLFGTALINFLRHLQTPIDRWIVCGTSASLWPELNQILPDPLAVAEEYDAIDQRVMAKAVDAAALQAWQAVLDRHRPPLDLRLCLTGPALAPESQQQIAQALFTNIAPGNDVVVDISHGFRHQPIIATYIISLMRWTHNIQRVSFYSGVFEAREGDVTPVLELPICQRLIEATEAAAIMELTGNFAPLAKCLQQDAEHAWFLDNTNQLGQAKTKAQELRRATTSAPDVIQDYLAQRLHKRLEWSGREGFANRFQQAAQLALEKGDYFRAIILAYEALLIRTAHLTNTQPDHLAYETRQTAEQHLNSLEGRIDQELLKDIKHTRNACAHGTRPDRASVQQVLGSPQKFRELVQRAFDLYERLPEIVS